MLQAMRSGTKSPFMKAFLLFLAGGFAIWGIGDVSNGLFGSGDRAVKANTQTVTIYEAANEFELIRRSSLPNMNIGQALQIGLLDEVIGQLSRKAVFAAEADRLQLDVTRDMLRQAVSNEAAFQNEFGEFAEGRFLQILAQNGFTEETYLQRLRDSLIAQQLVQTVAEGGTYATGLSKALAQYQLEERTAQILRFDVLPDLVADPDTASLSAWYEENKSAYDAPALRDVQVLNMSLAKAAEAVTLNEDDIKLAYDTRSEEFITQETRAVRQMVFATEEEAQAAAAKIEDVSQFNDVAAEVLGWTESDVSLGDVTKTDLDVAFGEAVFAANSGEIVGPVQTAFGYNLGVVDAISEGGQQTLDDVRTIIEDALRTEAAIGQLFDNVNAVEDAIGAGATLAEAAASIGASLDTITGISRSGRTIDGLAYEGPAAELTTDSAFLTEAWAIEIDETSVVVEASLDNYFVVRAISEAEPRERTLTEVETRAITDWKREQAIIAARLAAEAALAEGDVAFGEAEESGKFQRSGAGLDEAAARLIANAAFSQEIGEAQLVETGEAALIVKTANLFEADASAVSDFTENLATSFNQLVQEDIGTALAIQLSDEHDLETYPEAVRQLLVAQGN